MWNNIRYKLARFMQGRYGNDALNQCFSVIVLIFIVLSIIFNNSVGRIFWYLGILLIIYMYFRMFSKNIPKRYQENQKFLSLKTKILGRFSSFTGKAKADAAFREKNKNYKIFSCPQCQQKIRIPKGKGKIMVRCPKCGNEFQKRT